MKEAISRRISVLAGCAVAVIMMVPASSPALTKEEAGEVLRVTGEAFSKIAESAMPAVVYISVEKNVNAERFIPKGLDVPEFFGDQLKKFNPKPFRQQGQGSGFIISEDGYILSNHHVVGDADTINVKLHDGRELEGTLVGTDEKSEVAIIKVDAKKLPHLKLGDSDKLRIAEWVLAIGNPFGLTETVTAGIVSAKGRNNVGIADYENFIQTDAAINPGNSGGPLLNTQGEVIGINTAIYSRSGGYMGVGFAIPVNMVKRIKDQLIAHGKVTRGYLGIMIQDLTPELAKTLDVKDTTGIIVSDVMADSAASEAGIEDGDIIVKLNGESVKGVGTFRNNVASHSPGEKLKLNILRDGKAEVITANLKALPDDSGAVAKAPATSVDKIGITVESVDAEMAEQLGYKDEDISGVLVTKVAPNSPAAEAGIRDGHLITRVGKATVASAKEYRKAVAELGDSKKIVMRVQSPNGARFVVIKID